MKYKALLRNGGSRVYSDFDQLVEELRNGKISTDLPWNDQEMRDQIVIKLYRDGKTIGVALKMGELYNLER